MSTNRSAGGCDCCGRCGLLEVACICQYRPKINSQVGFCLLTHETEYRKPTNTGRLIADCLESTKVYTWSRTAIDPDLERDLADPQYQHWLVYPAEGSEQQDRVVSFAQNADSPQGCAGKKHIFILFDATWQQAAKMVRKSPYLNHLPILSLSPEHLSQYHLRRTSQAHHLCTVEVAVELLELAGEEASASLLQDYFLVFSQHYMAARSGHGVKQVSEQMIRLLKEQHDEVS
ncbi:tRNA-uridine aminocarboxypropyltransferase [Alkalimarinus sediminis]|uniref:tRNA-uridine aminocarboxypropyltransferase n=1 Tax=Alkalimarinus sediminis TaxID=1632866 RepID=A0A9E8HRQ1_9ALTE|nr:DTW domain-containing protein [Alkalimarinus sediminis]UZW75251.1 DTW domain-containing protein [Alkalimarinus sediminis]